MTYGRRRSLTKRIVWKDEVTDEALRGKTGSNTTQSTLKERRVRCLGHVHCTEISTLCVKNVTRFVSRYNSDKRESIWIIFDRNFTDKIGSQRVRYFHKSPNCCFYTTWTNRNPEIASYHSSAVTLHCRNSIASNILLLVFDCCGLRPWWKIHNRA